jgi:hypothetical protein
VNLTVDIVTSVSVIDAIAVQVEAMVDLQEKFFNPDEMTRGWTARVKAKPTRQRVHREAVGRLLRSRSGDDLMDESANGDVRRWSEKSCRHRTNDGCGWKGGST